jgi:hypothetical protein
MTAESGTKRTLTLGTSAGIEDTANSDIDIIQIYGVKWNS